MPIFTYLITIHFRDSMIVFEREPILLNATDIQREEIKKILGDAYASAITAKEYDSDYDPMDIFKWDHLTIQKMEDGFKLGAAKNVILLSEKFNFMELNIVVDFETFRVLCNLVKYTIIGKP